MTQIEYLIALLSILVGLALADIVQSLRALLRADRPVRWHWLPLAWTAAVLLMILQIWWGSFYVLQLEVFAQALPFFGYLLGFLALYLAASFVLPDPDMGAVGPTSFFPQEAAVSSGHSASGGEVLDLEQFYFSTPHRRRFFGALLAFFVFALMTTLSVRLIWQGDALTSTGVLHPLVINLVFAALLSSLFLTDRWWLHATAAVFTLGAVTFFTFLQGPLP